MPRPAKDRLGQRFGKLVVTAHLGSRNRATVWQCICDCGVIVEKLSSHLTDNCSCGCGRVQHGHTSVCSSSRTYRSWDSMKQRCLRPTYHGYHRYGGRGISVCPEWLLSFPQFLEDMGERPEGKTLDRKNTDGNYTPANCRWATPKEQYANRRCMTNG